MNLRYLSALGLTLFATPGMAAEAIKKQEPTIMLYAGEEPETKNWTQPASINYTDNADAADSWAIDIAGKYETAIEGTSHSMFTRAVVQKNTQIKKEVENYVAEVGAKLDLKTGADAHAWYLPTKISLAWSDKTTFPDPKATCELAPLPADCSEQQEESLRASASMLIFRSNWEDTVGYADSTHTILAGPPSGWTHSFLPVVTLFYDELLDSKVNPSGVKPDGSVLGGKILISLATSPAFSNFRLILSASVQSIYAFDRSNGRKATFARDSTMVRASADYELGQRSYLSGRGWIPAIGVSYTHGDDPLTGKLDQDYVMVGLKVTYRSE